MPYSLSWLFSAKNSRPRSVRTRWNGNLFFPTFKVGFRVGQRFASLFQEFDQLAIMFLVFGRTSVHELFCIGQKMDQPKITHFVRLFGCRWVVNRRRRIESGIGASLDRRFRQPTPLFAAGDNQTTNKRPTTFVTGIQTQTAPSLFETSGDAETKILLPWRKSTLRMVQGRTY